MKCPFCNEEMESGDLEVTRQSLYWYAYKQDSIYSSRKSIELCKMPILKRGEVKAFNCQNCSKIVIDYSR